MQLRVSGTYRSLGIEGPIEAGDYERFLKIAKENQGNLSGVYLFSAGGDFVEAMKIGRALRALELSSQVPMRNSRGKPECDDSSGLFPRPRDPANCNAASAAFFIHIGAVHRGGTYISVHRPYYEPGRFANLTEAQAESAYNDLQRDARIYMSDMGVPPYVQDEILAIPSDKAVLLDERTIKTHFWGEMPYRYEWRKAKCGRLTQAEAQRLDEIGAKLLGRSVLNSEERADLSRLRGIRDQERNCNVALSNASRVAAYQKFFGAAPDDTANHDFGKWAETPKYLGRTFEEASSEERFEADGSGAWVSLKRAATASSPTVLLMDSPNRKKYVSSVGALQANPSDAFIRRVVASLESAWGKPVSVSGEQAWTWHGRGFVATLKREPTSSEGPYLILVVDAASDR